MRKIIGCSSEPIKISPEEQERLDGLIGSLRAISKNDREVLLRIVKAATVSKYYISGNFSEDILILKESKAFNRLKGKSMAWKNTNKSSKMTRDRILHELIFENLIRRFARETGHNEDLGAAIALGHDIGHTYFGHEGEKWNRIDLKQRGLGTFAHNIQSAKILNGIERLGIHWRIIEGAQRHNGERLAFKVTFNPDQTEEDVTRDRIEAQIRDGYERQQVPASFLTAAGILIDKIAYVGQDLADGFREGVLNPKKMDPELIKIIKNFGLSSEDIQRLLQQDEETTRQVLANCQSQLANLKSKTGNTIIQELLKDINALKEVDFYEGYEFFERIDKIASKIDEHKDKLTEITGNALNWGFVADELREQMVQDTTGGTLARTIEEILIEDMIRETNMNPECPAISERMGLNMYRLIGYVQENVIPLVLTEKQSSILQSATIRMKETYANLLLSSGFIDEKFPEYKKEPKDNNKDKGIWDDPEAFEKLHMKDPKKRSKIIGHLRKCPKEYFEETRAIVEGLSEQGINHTYTKREAAAYRLATDYLSRNTDEELVRKAYERGFIIDKEYKILMTRDEKLEPMKIVPGTSMYETRVGMQTDLMSYIKSRLPELGREAVEKKNTYREYGLNHNPKVVNISSEYSEMLSSLLDKIKQLQKEHATSTAFESKRTHYETAFDLFDRLLLARDKFLDLQSQIELVETSRNDCEQMEMDLPELGER